MEMILILGLIYNNMMLTCMDLGEVSQVSITKLAMPTKRSLARNYNLLKSQCSAKPVRKNEIAVIYYISSKYLQKIVGKCPNRLMMCACLQRILTAINKPKIEMCRMIQTSRCRSLAPTSIIKVVKCL